MSSRTIQILIVRTLEFEEKYEMHMIFFMLVLLETLLPLFVSYASRIMLICPDYVLGDSLMHVRTVAWMIPVPWGIAMVFLALIKKGPTDNR